MNATRNITSTATGASDSWRFILVWLLGALLLSLPLKAQDGMRGLAIDLNSITILDEDDDFNADEPYLIVTQFRMRAAADFSRIVPGTLEVRNILSGHNDLGHSGDNWAEEGNTYEFGPVFAKTRVPAGEEGWILGAAVVHLEEDGFPGWLAQSLAQRIEQAIRDALSGMAVGIPDVAGVRSEISSRVVEEISRALRNGNIVGLVEGLVPAVTPDDFGGVGLVMLKTGRDNSMVMFAGKLPRADRAAAVIAAGLRPVTATQPFTFDFPFGDGHHQVNGRAPVLFPGDWTQTPAVGMGDVAVGPDRTAWLAGRNGTIWNTRDGVTFNYVPASGFESVAVSNAGLLWAVGGNGTLWSHGPWLAKAPAGTAADVSTFGPGTVWIVRRDGRIASSFYGEPFVSLPETTRFRRISADAHNVLWATRDDGSLLKRIAPGRWVTSIGPETASNVGVEDVAAGADGRVWVVRRDGTIWMSRDGTTYSQVLSSGFRRIAVGNNGQVWAVGTNGSVWHFNGNLI